MSKEQLAEIKKWAEAATPGPWELEFDSDVTDLDYGSIVNWPWRILSPNVADHPIVDFSGTEICDEDALFITHSRADIPALLAEIERLTIGINDLVKRWRDYANEPAASKVGRIVAGDCADELVMLIVA